MMSKEGMDAAGRERWQVIMVIWASCCLGRSCRVLGDNGCRQTRQSCLG